ncbi:MAG: 3-deoxy-manno-octulosonate cytidylyltransferase [Betaproteobacteria bacterium]|jgi:3-deoxy-manno-octulosonate cytidylyltransferase (CMP-KDO synthetase)|nr:3-deoxy-manno-octulosonate cytidylyltransferase [Betaproteobacteria bacterium]
MDFWTVIPARRASTRLPDKPLADIGGRPMVVRVAERAQASGASRVIVATDDQEIQDACTAYGIEATLTRADHQSGTDRIAEVAQRLRAAPTQCIVNVQGDEPFIAPALIRDVAQQLTIQPAASVATAAAAVLDPEHLQSPHIVKVVCDAAGLALYFSRAPIPYQRNLWPSLQQVGMPRHADDKPIAFRHIGIYAFRTNALAAFVGWPVCPIEQAEQLEQLRWLWHGHRIAVHYTETAPAPGVDTPEDLQRIRQMWAEQHRA